MRVKILISLLTIVLVSMLISVACAPAPKGSAEIYHYKVICDGKYFYANDYMESDGNGVKTIIFHDVAYMEFDGWMHTKNRTIYLSHGSCLIDEVEEKIYFE